MYMEVQMKQGISNMRDKKIRETQTKYLLNTEGKIITLQWTNLGDTVLTRDQG